MRKGFETVCVYTLTSSVVSVSLFPGLCIVSAADGLITGFDTSKPDAPNSFMAPVPVTQVMALEDMLIAAGGKSLLIWRIH